MKSPEQVDTKDFLKEDMSLSYLDEGDFVSVEEFKLKKEKEGDESKFVLKEYDLEEIEDLFEDRGLSLEEKAKILKRRQEFTQKFYDGLPSIVVKSQFILGGGSNNQATIFEIQDKISDYYTIDESDKIVQELNIQQKESLMKELDYFITRTGDFLHQRNDTFPGGYEEYYSCFPDIHSDNLVITSDGHLKMIDTNMYKNLWEEDATLDEAEKNLNAFKLFRGIISRSIA